MNKEHFDNTVKEWPEIGKWMKRVAAKVGIDRMERNDFHCSIPAVYIKPKKRQYNTRTWREYRAFDNRTYKLAIRPFKSDEK